MKKSIAIFVLSIFVTGFTFAGGLDLHVGTGYFASFEGNTPKTINKAAAMLPHMPIGFSSYAGIGYGFGDSRFFNLGLEANAFLSFSIDPFGDMKAGIQGRAYSKFRFSDSLSLSLFGGVQLNSITFGSSLFGSVQEGIFNRDFANFDFDFDFAKFESDFESALPSVVGNPVFGLRIAFLFLYAEYAMVLPSIMLPNKDFNIARHEVSIGWAILE